MFAKQGLTSDATMRELFDRRAAGNTRFSADHGIIQRLAAMSAPWGHGDLR